VNSLTDIVVQGKRFISVGRPGGGVNFSGDIFAGIVIDELAGPTTNWSFSFGVVSITVFTDPEAGAVRRHRHTAEIKLANIAASKSRSGLAGPSCAAPGK